MVCFGVFGFDYVFIFRVIQVSMVLFGLYVLVDIDGCYYVDGMFCKGLYVLVVFEDGVDLVFVVNFQVFIDVSVVVCVGIMKSGELIWLGMLYLLL